MVRPPKNIQWWWSPQKPLKIYNGLFKTIEICNGLLKTITLVNGLLKSLKFTMFSEKNGTFLWSQLKFSILFILFCGKKSNFPLPVINNIHLHCKHPRSAYPQDKLCKAECDIRKNFDTNEYPNIFVSKNLHEWMSEYIHIKNLTRTNVRINIRIENCTNIRIYSNIRPIFTL